MCGTRLSTKQLVRANELTNNLFFKRAIKVLHNKTFMESLILAQDERWRRA